MTGAGPADQRDCARTGATFAVRALACFLNFVLAVVSMNSRRFTVGSRGSVIVVNEPDAQRQLVLQLFLARGFRALAAESGRMALQLAREQRPDVILMDMDRPTLDGWESTRRLKADPVTRHILVVALSEDTQTDKRNQAMRVGCDGFEAKPIDVEHLVACVENLLPAQGV
jgi:two-component system cell cycle response regulator DivK